MYLLDTDICIYLIKHKASVRARFERHPLEAVRVSSVSVSELWYGVQKSAHVAKNRRALEKFLLPIEIADYDWAAAEEYGVVRADLERRGTPIGSMDMLIAAHARSLRAVLVTNNEREFVRVPDLEVQNWAKPED